MKMIGKGKRGIETREIPPCMEAAYVKAGWVEAEGSKSPDETLIKRQDDPGAKFDAGGGAAAPVTKKPAKDEKPASVTDEPAETAKDRAQKRGK